MARHSGIKDQGEFFVIDPLSRSVKVPTAHRVIGTEGEHLSEQVTFECPQIIDGHDISQCERHYVAWRNVDGTPGSDDLKTDRTEEGKVYFIWTIRDGLTASKGLVQFSVHFEDDAEPYRWGTTTCKNCEILESINAAFGLYKAIYVAGDALVIADYTPVEDKTLTIDSALKPEALEITANGTYDVVEYATAEVEIIDTNLIPENIREDIKIFGVTGTYNPIPLVQGTIVDGIPKDTYLYIDTGAKIFYSRDEKFDAEAEAGHLASYSDGGEFFTSKFIKDIPIIIMPARGNLPGNYNNQLAGFAIDLAGDVELVQKALDGSLFVVRPTGDNFTVLLRAAKEGEV